MFFGAYLGEPEHEARWRRVAQRHADWLRLAAQLESRRLADGRVLSIGWFQDPACCVQPVFEETSERLILPTAHWPVQAVEPARDGQPVEDRLRAYVEANVVGVAVTLATGELAIAVPPFTPEPFYYAGAPQQRVLANDLRLMAAWTGLDIDVTGALALLQYGSIPAELTIVKGVERVPHGHLATFSAQSERPSVRPFFVLEKPAADALTDSEAEERLCAGLDGVLARVPPATVLLFSGGVDSGLMAARLAALGRRDVQLIHYSFGPDDPESAVALQMAAALRLPCRQVVYDPHDVAPMLDRLVRDYSFPFADFSSTVTNVLVHASADAARAARCALDGTGADGAWGVGLGYPDWCRVYRTPKLIRRLGSAAFKYLRLYQRPTDKTGWEAIGRIFRRSVQMPFFQAAIVGQNALDGIAFYIPDEMRRRIEACIRAHEEVLAAGLEPRDQMAVLDLIHVCAGEFASKDFDPLRGQGIEPLYPYMMPSMVRLATSIPWELKLAGGQKKTLLKKALARAVPPELVYRRKRGFVPPIHEILAFPPVHERAVDVVMSAQNPLLALLEQRVVRRLFERVRGGRTISVGASSFLWCVIFASTWLRQLRAQVTHV